MLRNFWRYDFLLNVVLLSDNSDSDRKKGMYPISSPPTRLVPYEQHNKLFLKIWTLSVDTEFELLPTKNSLRRPDYFAGEAKLTRLLKFCQSHAIPLSGTAKSDLPKFKQPAVTFCLNKIVWPRQ